MPEIAFTQYLLPNGRKEQIFIDRPQNIWEKSQKIIEAEYKLEAEVLTNGTVSLTITGKNTDVYMKLVFNQTPDKITSAVDELIEQFDFDEARKIDEEAA